ncbi:BtrH N-terminal domain-containing protein [Chloroflexota bacterium]
MIKGLEPFIGKHCETTALKRVLDYHGLSISEEMLLGLGGGIGFIYWYTKMMPSPFVGGRSGKSTDFSANICRRIGAEVIISETSSSKKGYEELKALLAAGEPAVVYGDMAYLPYFAIPEVAHFGGHVFVVFGLDETKDEVYIYDRGIKPVMVSITNLAKARGSKFPPFPPKHRLLKIKYPVRIENLEESIKASIRECCQNMLKPPIKNLGLTGMGKWSKELMKWPVQFQGMNLLGVLLNGFIYIETGGTGGSAFRLMYAKFLEEAGKVIGQPVLKEVAEMMRKSAAVWSNIALGYLPDSLPNLGRIRKLIVEKNELFEKQTPGNLESMRKINGEMDYLMERAVEDLKKAPEFLLDVQKDIGKCYQIEKEAFQILSNI